MTAFWKDVAERVAWTAAQAGLGVLIVVLTDVPYGWAALIVPLLSALKGMAARRVGDPETAALTFGASPDA